MSANELNNWIAVYAATSVCCVFAVVLSVTTVVIELYRERAWRAVTNVKSALWFGPQLWWRWQKRYLFSTPVTLVTVAWFALTLDWTH